MEPAMVALLHAMGWAWLAGCWAARQGMCREVSLASGRYLALQAGTRTCLLLGAGEDDQGVLGGGVRGCVGVPAGLSWAGVSLITAKREARRAKIGSALATHRSTRGKGSRASLRCSLSRSFL